MSEKKHNILTGGVVLITLGVLIFLHKSGSYPFGQTWPILIIVIGLSTIIQRKRDFGGWFITIAGVAFLINELYGLELQKSSQYMFPAILVLLGIFALFMPNKLRGIEMKKYNGTLIGLGVAGFLIGGLIAFLVRPFAPLIGQLSFDAVISRGANLTGINIVLIPLAQKSFNMMVIGAIIGAIVGAIIGYFVGHRKSA